MLVVARLVGESIKINDDITVQVVSSTYRNVRIGIEAPKHVSINREELYNEKLRTSGRKKLPVGLVTLVKCFNSQFMPDDVAQSVFGDTSDDTTDFYVGQDLQTDCPHLYNWFIDNGAAHDDRVIVERGSWTK